MGDKEKKPSLRQRANHLANRFFDRFWLVETAVGGLAVAEVVGTVTAPRSQIIEHLSSNYYDIPGIVRRLNEAGMPPAVTIGFIVLAGLAGSYIFLDGIRRGQRQRARRN